MPAPVRANGKHVDTQALDIVDLLTFILFDDNLVGNASSPNALNTFAKGLRNIYFAAHLIKTISRNTND